MRRQALALGIAVLVLGVPFAGARSAGDPSAPLGEIVSSLKKLIADVRAGHVPEVAALHTLEGQKGAALLDLPPPFDHSRFREYFRAFECVDRNAHSGQTKNEQVRLQVAQERCAHRIVQLLEQDFERTGAAGGPLGQARQLERAIKSYGSKPGKSVSRQIIEAEEQKHDLLKLFPPVLNRPFSESYFAFYELDKALDDAIDDAKKGKASKALLVDLLSASGYATKLRARLRGKQLFDFSFEGLHASFLGPLVGQDIPRTSYVIDVSGTGCGADPLEARWTVKATATQQPQATLSIDFERTNPFVFSTYRWILQGTQIGDAKAKLLLVAGAAPRMELQVEATGVESLTIDPSRNSLRQTKTDVC